MNILIIIFCFFLAYIYYKRNNSIYNPTTLFLGVWGVLFFVYNLGRYPLPAVSDVTYRIVLVGLFSFFAGTLISNIKKKKTLQILDRVERNKSINIMIIAFFVLIIRPFLNALGLFARGVDLHDIRYVYHDEIMGSGLYSIAFVYFCEPFLTFLIVYSVVNLYQRNRDIKYLLLCIIGNIMMVVTTGGRFFLLYLLFSLILVMMIYNKDAMTKKIKKYVFVLSVLAVSSLLVVSIIRGSDPARTFYVYLSGCIPFMDHLINDEMGNVPPLFGVYSLNGFLRPIFVTLRALHITDMPVFMTLCESIQLQADEAYQIMPGEYYNSFTSLFYSMYWDGRLLGVGLGCFVLSMLVNNSYHKLNLKSPFTISMYLLFALILLLSFFRLLTVTYSYALSFVYLYLCYRKTVKI